MPNYRQTGHRLRAGTHAVVDLTSAYALTALPKQTDQGDVPWVAPAQNSTPPQPTGVNVALSGRAVPVGPYTWTWVLSYLTFDMFKHLQTTFLTDTGGYSGDVTVMTYDENDEVVYLTAKLLRPAELTPWVGGWRDVTFTFVKGVIIT